MVKQKTINDGIRNIVPTAKEYGQNGNFEAAYSSMTYYSKYDSSRLGKDFLDIYNELSRLKIIWKNPEYKEFIAKLQSWKNKDVNSSVIKKEPIHALSKELSYTVKEYLALNPDSKFWINLLDIYIFNLRFTILNLPEIEYANSSYSYSNNYCIKDYERRIGLLENIAVDFYPILSNELNIVPSTIFKDSLKLTGTRKIDYLFNKRIDNIKTTYPDIYVEHIKKPIKSVFNLWDKGFKMSGCEDKLISELEKPDVSKSAVKLFKLLKSSNTNLIYCEDPDINKILHKYHLYSRSIRETRYSLKWESSYTTLESKSYGILGATQASRERLNMKLKLIDILNHRIIFSKTFYFYPKEKLKDEDVFQSSANTGIAYSKAYRGSYSFNKEIEAWLNNKIGYLKKSL